MINFFLYCIKKMNFSGSPNGTPHDWCRRTMKKDYFAMKTNGIRWSSSKNDDEYFHWGPIFYVCSSARNWVSSMYKGIYHIRNSLWGVATVDVWSSSTRPFQQKTGLPKWSISFYIVPWTSKPILRIDLAECVLWMIPDPFCFWGWSWDPGTLW